MSLVDNAFDAASNNITGECTLVVTSSNPAVLTVGGTATVQANGFAGIGVTAHAVGTATVTRTVTNPSGSETDTDTFTVVEAPPASQTATWA